MTQASSSQTLDNHAKLCAIHQPNFFPWLGYFDKIERADVFIFFDAVDYPRRSWTNRVNICVQGEAHWLGAPVSKPPLNTPIKEVLFDDAQPWREKILRTIERSYRKAPGWDHAMALLEPLVLNPERRLAEYNMHAITAIADALGKCTKFFRQSDLDYYGTATELLISLVKSAGCDAYLAGGGAGGYQEDDLFERSGIGLVYQGFEPKPYGDPERFLPGLSIIDYLMQTPEALAGRDA